MPRVAAILNLDVSFNSEKHWCCSSILCSPSLNKIQHLFYRTYNLFNRSKSLKFRKEFWSTENKNEKRNVWIICKKLQISLKSYQSDLRFSKCQRKFFKFHDGKNGIYLHCKMERFHLQNKELSPRVFRQKSTNARSSYFSTFRRVTFPSSSLQFSRFRLFSYIPPDIILSSLVPQGQGVSLHSGRVLAGNGNQISEFH